MIALDRRHFLMTVVGACGWPTTAARSASADALPLIELPGRVEAPDFTLPDLAGGPHRLSDFRGRPVLISFWAVWCAPCRRELPAIAALRSRLKDTNIEVLAVDLGDSLDRIRAFLADHPLPSLPILLGGRAIGKAWHVQGLPVAYVVDGNGTLRFGTLGERDWNAPVIERQLRGLATPGYGVPAPAPVQPI